MKLSRRLFSASLAAGIGSRLLEPLRAAAKAAKPVRITGIDIFRIEIDTPKEEVAAGKLNIYDVAKVDTDAGVRGYSFVAPYQNLLPQIRQTLVGKDLFAIEDHLKAGLIDWGGVEHALWDAIGKIAGQPVYRLLGGGIPQVRAYITCVWPGNVDQSHVPYRAQAEQALRLKNAGFRGMKIRAWRPNPTDDADACGEIRAAVGPDFAIMFDRTAHRPGKVWDYSTALRVAQAMEKHNAYWLEEPFDRDDFLSPARLAREVDIPITGGEGYRGMAPFQQCIANNTYDILQPDGVVCGGLFTVRKIAAMGEGFGVRVIQHGRMGLLLAGFLQASSAIKAHWQEIAIVTPPLLPQEQWSPALKILNSDSVFTFRNGEIEVPQGPGLGLDINEEAVARYRQKTA